MRFSTITTALYAVASTMAAPVDQANTGAVGVATNGKVTASVELVNPANAADGVRITYAAVDVDHPDKLAPPVGRFCWDFYKCAAALAPSILACAAAATEFGLNPVADAVCVAVAANSGINLPSACNGCF